MTSSARGGLSNSGGAAIGSTDSKSFFETQRDALVGEIAQNLEQVLQSINKLNRSLEGVIAVSSPWKGCDG